MTRHRVRAAEQLLLVMSALAIAALSAVGLHLVHESKVVSRTEPTLILARSQYRPGEMLELTGAHFPPGRLAVVVRPSTDGTATTESVSTSTRNTWESVTVAADGQLAYRYALTVPSGRYEVRVYEGSWSGVWSDPPLAKQLVEVKAG